MLRLICVKPFVKSREIDVNDSEATLEAALRPIMTFVANGTEEEQ